MSFLTVSHAISLEACFRFKGIGQPLVILIGQYARLVLDLNIMH